MLQELSNGDHGGPMLAVVALAVVALMPIIISISNSRRALKFGAVILCLASIIGTVFSVTMGGLFGAAFGVIVLGFAWIASLLCGIAALMDRMNSVRQDEMVFRLLNRDTNGLTVPYSLRKKNRKIESKD